MAEEGFLKQHQQEQPGKEHKMQPKPDFDPDYRKKGCGLLKNKVAIITGGDSGIGRAVAVLFAREGANIAIAYKTEDKDAEKTKELVEAEGGKCILLKGDIADYSFAEEIAKKTSQEFGGINILVNNAAEQHPQEDFMDITPEQLDRTFKTNIYGYFYLTRAVMPHLKKGDCIINTTSVTAYRGSWHLVDYASTKGAIVSFTRSLAANMAKNKTGIRVNGVAPGPIWTPLIPASFDADHVSEFGEGSPLGRAGQPEEVAPSYLFLACPDSSYITGQVLHPNGGEIING